MKAITCIMLLILLPFMAFAQDYTLTLKSSKESITCEVLGAANSYLYYQTPTASLVAVPVSSIKTLLHGNTDIAYRIQKGETIPFSPEAIKLFPSFSDSLFTAYNASFIQQRQVDELQGIKYTLQVMTALSLASIISILCAANKVK
jgi:hypothetical protein